MGLPNAAYRRLLQSIRGRPLALFCGVYLAGSAVGVSLLTSIALWFNVAVSFLLGWLAAHRLLTPLQGVVVAIALWLGSAQGIHYSWQRFQLWQKLPRDEAVVVEGQIITEPTRQAGNWRFIMRTKRLVSREAVWLTPIYLWVQAPEGLLQQAFAGDYLQVEGKIYVPAPTVRDPSGRFAQYLMRRGVYRTIRAYRAQVLATFGWRARFSRLRAWLLSNLRHHLPTREGNIAAAIVLNDRSKLDEQIREAFRHTGTVHILSPSGTHVSMLALSVWWVGQWIRLPKRWGAAAVVAVIWVFAAVAAGGEPAFRAAVMGTLVAGGIALQRESDLPTALALAGFLIALYDQSALLDPGYQFSFILVSALLAASGWLQAMQRKVSLHPGAWLLSALGVSAVCAAAAAPLTALYYGQVSLVAPAANLLIAIPVQVITSGGLLIACMPNLPEWLCTPVAASTWCVDMLVRGLARLPWAYMEVSTPSRGELLGFYLLFFTTLLWLSWRASRVVEVDAR